MTDLTAAYDRLCRSTRAALIAAAAISLARSAHADPPVLSTVRIDSPLLGDTLDAAGTESRDLRLEIGDLREGAASGAPTELDVGRCALDVESGIIPAAGLFSSLNSQVSSLSSPGPVEVRRYKTLRRNVQTGDLEATGDVQVVYTDPKDQKQTTLTAQSISYNGTTGQMEAHGGVRMDREEGTFVGQDLSYNFREDTGTVTNAILETDYFRMRGERIIARGDGTYEVDQGTFTTCIRANPDYHIHAHRLIVAPNQYVSARGISFYAGKTKLITWPSYRRNLRAGSQGVPLPLPGYNNTDGFFVQFHDTPILERHTTLDFLARVGYKRFPTGAAAYETDMAPSAYNAPPPRTILPLLGDPLRGFLEQLTPPTYTEYTESVFAEQYAPRSLFNVVIENQQFVYNRRYNNLSVSRYPEVGVRLVNVLGNRAQNPNEVPATAPPEQNPVLGSTEGALRRVPNAPFLFNLDAGIGELHEDPTRVTAGRLALRASLASQPFILGKRISLRAGLSSWMNLYTTGTAYNITSPEVEFNYIPTRTSRFGVGYRYLSQAGRTPFFFDRRDIRNDLHIEYQVGGPWAFGILSRIDLDRTRSYDTEFAVLRNFDCMQVGIVYRVRSSSFNIIFNLLPPTRGRARRQQLPLTGTP